jgi:hypothetical protein
VLRNLEEGGYVIYRVEIRAGYADGAARARSSTR